MAESRRTAQHSPSVVLDSQYYLRHFQDLLRIVDHHYRALMTEAEAQFLDTFYRLDEPAQCLYVRLANRRPRYFRIERLNYPEIGPLAPVLERLERAALLRRLDVTNESPASECAFDALEVFSRRELLTLTRADSTAPSAWSRLRKHDLCEAIVETFGAQETVRRLAARAPLIEVVDRELVRWLKFLFFGSPWFDMEQFILRDLGHTRFEEHDPALLQRRFNTRREIDDVLRVQSLSDRFETERARLPPREVYEHLIVHLRDREGFDPAAWPALERLGARVGRWLERTAMPDEALDCYRHCTRPPAPERRVRLLHKLGERAAAIALCRRLLRESNDATERLFAADYLARARQRATRVSTTQTLRTASVLTLDQQHVEQAHSGRVERAVLAHYRQCGWDGAFTENGLWRSLFGIVLWEVLFDAHSGAIHHPLQRAPTDLTSTAFFAKRRASIEQALRRLDAPDGLQQMLARLDDKWGISNPFVVWHERLPEILSRAWRHLSASQIKAVIREMARNVRANRRGFPDVFLWSPTAQGYLFIEVKSPTDHLRPQQRHWLQFFLRHGIHTRLLKIEWRSSAPTN